MDGAFPGYQVLRELDPLGDVRRLVARDLGLDRTVEIHHLPAATPERVAEFRRRAGILARLNHPAIAPVHRIGQEGGGEVYYVMPCLPGSSLAVRLTEAPLPYGEAVQLTHDLLSALATAHAAGVIGGELDPVTIARGDGGWVVTGLGVPRCAPGSRWLAPEEHGGGSPTSASDVFVAGMVLRDAVGPDARRIAPVLAQATAPVPSERPDLATVRAAARRATRRRRWPAPVLAAGVLAACLGLAWKLGSWPFNRASTIVYDVAVVPFVAGINHPDTIAYNVSGTIQYDLRGVPGLRVASWWVPKVLDTDSPGQVIGPELVTAELADRLRARRVVHGRVDLQGQTVRVTVFIYDHDNGGEGKSTTLVEDFVGSKDAIPPLGDSLARRVLNDVAPAKVARYAPRIELQGVPFAALNSFLRGEEAFAQDALAQAEAFYDDAVRPDPSFALAEWRRANVRRWRRLSQVDLEALYRRGGARLGPTDRRLLEALIEPDLERRFAILDSAVAADPTDAYARLIYGEEMWHRGPLVGHDLSDALEKMNDAVAADSALSLAYDHIVMYHIREGDRAAAQRVLRLKSRVTLETSPDDVDTRRFLELALNERFHPWRAELAHAVLRWWPSRTDLEGLAKVARLGTPWFDLPAAQVRLSDILLTRTPAGDGAKRGSARIGTALGLMAQGKAGEGLAQFDSAAVELGSEEMELQRAEWRLIPPALGLHGWPRGAPDSLLRWLEQHAGDSVLGPRVRWTMALGRLADGDTSGFVHDVDALPAAGDPLGALLRAVRAGLGHGGGEARTIADSVRQAVHLTRPPDPFAPAVLHLFEGERAARSHDADAADRAWRWYLAAEFEGWPTGPPQAGEVDGVLGMLARRRRAELRLAAGTRAADTTAACVMMRRVAELWRGADSGLAWMARVPGPELPCRR
jgi:TolB-like protein